MPDPPPAILRHIDYSGRAHARKYTAKGARSGAFKVFPRRRSEHAQKLQRELRRVQQEADRLRATQELAEYTDDAGVTLEIRGEPNYPLNTKALDAPGLGSRCSMSGKSSLLKPEGEPSVTTVATVFVANGKFKISDQASCRLRH